MRIGLSYDLKEAVPLTRGSPEDALAEYDCTETLGYIIKALEGAGHSVSRLGGGPEFLSKVLNEKVDFVFNISEGRGNYRSREAQVPGVLEMLDIPYSASDPQCLAVCLDKPLTKQIVSLAGVRTPKWCVIASAQELGQTEWRYVSFPAIVKPAWEGSSKGIGLNSLVNNAEEAVETVQKILGRYCQSAMVEEFISGDEVTVGIVGNFPPKIVGLMRVVPRKKSNRFVYSIEVKRDWKTLVDYECPAVFKNETLEEISAFSLTAFKALGCRDVGRIDFRVDAKGLPYFIEINPLPGLGDYSDLVIMAIKMGWTHESLIQAILKAALERYPSCVHSSHSLQ